MGVKHLQHIGLYRPSCVCYSARMMRLITKLLIVVLALLLVERVVPGVEVESFYTALIVALILGLLNVLVRPLLLLLTLPVTIITLGLFVFVLNGLLFWFVSTFVDGFTVDGFIPAILGALFVSAVNWLLSKLLDK